MALGSAGNDVILSVDAVTKPAEDGLDRVKRKLREVTEETKKADRAAKDHQQTLSKQIQAGGRMAGGAGGRAAGVMTGGMQAGGMVGGLVMAGAGIGVAYTALEHIMSLQEQHIRKQVEWEQKLTDARKSAVDSARATAAGQVEGMAAGWRKMVGAGGGDGVSIYNDLMRSGVIDSATAMQVATSLGGKQGGAEMAGVVKSAAQIGVSDLPKLAEQLAKNPGIMAQGNQWDRVAMAASMSGQRMTGEDARLALASVSQDRLLSATQSAGQFRAGTAEQLRAKVAGDPGMLLKGAAEDRMKLLAPEAYAENQLFQQMQRQNEVLERLLGEEGALMAFLRDLTKAGSFKTQLARERGGQASAVFAPAAGAVSPAAP